jgi:hypothetical protein
MLGPVVTGNDSLKYRLPHNRRQVDEKRGFDQVRLVIEADPVKLLKMTLRAVHCQLLATQRDGVFS